MNSMSTERLLTPSKITAWLDCAHYLTLRALTEKAIFPPLFARTFPFLRPAFALYGGFNDIRAARTPFPWRKS